MALIFRLSAETLARWAFQGMTKIISNNASYPHSFHNFHQASESEHLLTPFLKYFFPELPGMDQHIMVVLLSCSGEILHRISRSFRFINLDQAKQPVVCKQASSKHFRDVYFFHPRQPLLVDGPVYL